MDDLADELRLKLKVGGGAAVACPRGHPLVDLSVPSEQWTCDARKCKIGGAFEADAQRAFGCEACGYDLCTPCYAQAAEDGLKPVSGRCKCGKVRYHFPAEEVVPLGDGGTMAMVKCHCAPCRKAHGAFFATFVPVRTTAIVCDKGRELIRAREDKCAGVDGGSVRRLFCGECFSALATLPSKGSVVHISAGPLLDTTLPTALAQPTFVEWRREEAPVLLGFVPSKRAGRRKAKGLTPVSGGCACGACRFTLKDFPSELQHCYCRLCRRLSGAAFQTWSSINEGDLKWTKHDSLKLVRTAEHGQRHVCTKCGVFMTIVYDADGAIWPVAGVLDDAYTEEDVKVTEVSHICVKWKQCWLTLPDDRLPRWQHAG